MSWTRRIITGVFVAALAGGALWAARPRPLTVEAARVERGHLEASLDEEGRTRVRDRYVISSTVTGNVRRAELRPGDAVEPGAVVARILPVDPDAARRSLAGRRARSRAARRGGAPSVAVGRRAARAALEFARAEVARLRGLVSSGATAPHDLTVAEFEVRSRTDELASAQFATRGAEYELANARSLLARGTGAASSSDEIELRSPVRGRVLRVALPSGGVVTAGAPLLEIGDTTALEIVIDLLTADAAQVTTGSTVRIDAWGGDGALTGHVRLVEPSAFTRTSALGVEEQRVNALVDLNDPPARWRTLGDGWRVEAHITVWEGDNVVTVPTGALFRKADAWCAFVIDGGRARRRTVTLGHRGGDRVEITQGLRAGETVIVHPSDRLADGDAVAPE